MGGIKVVVGLGNPGSQYQGTRHNVGFATVDLLSQAPQCGRFTKRFDAEVAESLEGLEKVLLIKPQTFMNLSGRTVRQALDYYQLTPADLLVICDDIALPLGQIRFRSTGSAGGHNGLKDIQRHLGTLDYPRLKLGVGGPGQQILTDYVLSRFKPVEKDTVDQMLLLASSAVVQWIHQGTTVCMNRYNGPPAAEKKVEKKKKQREAKATDALFAKDAKENTEDTVRPGNPVQTSNRTGLTEDS